MKIKTDDIVAVKKRLQEIRLPGEGEETARNLRHIDELSTAFIVRQLPFPKINELKKAVEKGEFVPIIPNHSLHDLFELVVPRRINSQNHLYLYAYLFAAISLTISSFFLSNYWLLLSIPVAFVSFSYLSGTIGGRFYNGLVVLAGIILINNDYTTFGVLLFLHAFSIWCGLALRSHRRTSMIRMAFADEEIFWFLFSTNTMSMYDTRIRKSIYKGCKKPDAAEYTEANF